MKTFRELSNTKKSKNKITFSNEIVFFQYSDTLPIEKISKLSRFISLQMESEEVEEAFEDFLTGLKRNISMRLGFSLKTNNIQYTVYVKNRTVYISSDVKDLINSFCSNIGI